MRVGDHGGRLARPVRHRAKHVQQRAVVVAVDLDDLEAEGGQLVGERLEVVGVRAGRPAAGGCGRRSTREVLEPGLPAVITASQLQPSCSSPSPTTTNVRRRDPSSLAAKAVPTAIGRPWPSGPVLASTPGDFVRSGWPLSWESGCMKVASSSGEEAGVGQRGVERGGGVALGQDEAVPLGVVEPVRGDVHRRR